MKLQKHPGQPMDECVNVIEKAVPDMKAEALNVGPGIFSKKSNMSHERQERVSGTAEGELEFAAIRGALIKLFLDTIIRHEKRSVLDRKPGHVTGRKSSDRF